MIADTPEEDFRTYFHEPEQASDDADSVPAAASQNTDLDRGMHTSGPGSAHQRTGVCPPVAGGLSNPDSLTCENDRFTSTSRSVKTVEVHNNVPATPAPGGAGDTVPRETIDNCELCNTHGWFVDGDRGCSGTLVELLTDNAEDVPRNVKCQHSMEGNLAEIRRIECESNGTWGAAKSGWYAIDKQYGFCDDDYYGSDGRIIFDNNDVMAQW